MYDLLHGMTVIEGASFVAGPSCGLYLAQLGATVIRFDQLGGGHDARRWPLADSGESYYWQGLNKNKLSVTLDFSQPRGRELAQRLAAAGVRELLVISQDTSAYGVDLKFKLDFWGGRPSLTCALRLGPDCEVKPPANGRWQRVQAAAFWSLRACCLSCSRSSRGDTCSLAHHRIAGDQRAS